MLIDISLIYLWREIKEPFRYGYILTELKAIGEHFSMLSYSSLGWSGGAMVLGKLPVPGRPTIWIIVGQGPIVLSVGAGGIVWTFLLLSILSLLFLPLSERRSDID